MRSLDSSLSLLSLEQPVVDVQRKYPESACVNDFATENKFQNSHVIMPPMTERRKRDHLGLVHLYDVALVRSDEGVTENRAG